MLTRACTLLEQGKSYFIPPLASYFSLQPHRQFFTQIAWAHCFARPNSCGGKQTERMPSAAQFFSACLQGQTRFHRCHLATRFFLPSSLPRATQPVLWHPMTFSDILRSLNLLLTQQLHQASFCLQIFGKGVRDLKFD